MFYYTYVGGNLQPQNHNYWQILVLKGFYLNFGKISIEALLSQRTLNQILTVDKVRNLENRSRHSGPTMRARPDFEVRLAGDW